MFSWVCPRCGRDNPPSLTECPRCKEQDAAQAAHAAQWQASQPVAVPQGPPVMVPQGPPAVAEQPAYAPPVYAPPAYTPAPEPPPQYAPPQQQQASPQPPPQPQYPQQQPPQYAQQQPPQYAPPPQQYSQPQYAHPPQYAPPQHAPQYGQPPKYTPPSATPAQPPTGRSFPTWLLTILFAFGILAAGAAFYYGYQRFVNKSGSAGFTGGEQPSSPTHSKASSPLQKYIEVVGIRLTTDAKKKPQAKFLVVNHASAEMNDLTVNVTLWASTSRSEEDSIGTFTFTVPNLSGYESKEMTAPFKTKLKIYELPDWQNATAEVQITSPQ
jgi:hypothetical protein